jgi:hypothetical protein
MPTWLITKVAWRVVLRRTMIDGSSVSDFHFWRSVLLHDGCSQITTDTWSSRGGFVSLAGFPPLLKPSILVWLSLVIEQI